MISADLNSPENSDDENKLTEPISNAINPGEDTSEADNMRIEIVHETRKKKSPNESIEQTQTKNKDAAAEAQEGDFGDRSYASPDFDKD